MAIKRKIGTKRFHRVCYVRVNPREEIDKESTTATEREKIKNKSKKKYNNNTDGKQKKRVINSY